MSPPAYQPLSHDLLGQLLAPGNEAMARSWKELQGALQGVIAMLSLTYPRPLYHYEDSARRDLVEQPERLRGTPFHEPAVRNVLAAEEIERMFHEQGHTPELHAIVDSYLNTLLDEFGAMRLYPEIPSPRVAGEENGIAGDHRAVAGR